ncbi:MAG: hypothetical protein Fur0037_11790 [Planctomycetota bacterium]
MNTHYEARLQKDLDWIEDLLGIVGAGTEQAIGDAVKAVTTLDRDLAAKTVLGDYVINRQTRELDWLCHAFVARHLPSAGHLRFVSSVMRLATALERIGDYACTISRTASQLSAPPTPQAQRDIEVIGEHARKELHDSMRAFLSRDVARAQVLIQEAASFTHNFDRVFEHLAREGDEGLRPTIELFALMATFNRLDRVIHQAKNICEETVFVCTGRMKSERRFEILFVDRDGRGAGHLAENFARKAFPRSGNYRCASLEPAQEIDPSFVEFAERNGLDLSGAWPTPFSALASNLSSFQIVVCLEKGLRDILGKIPFHTTAIEWDLDPSAKPEDAYKTLTPRIRELMELLRGEHAC